MQCKGCLGTCSSHLPSKRAVLTVFVASWLALSCEWGVFNKNFPNSSQLTAYVDESADEAYSSAGVLSFFLDDDSINGKTLRIEASHLKGTEKTKGGFTFSSDTLALSVVNEKSAVVQLDRIRTLGVHVIKAASSVNSTFDRSFLVCAYSAIKDFDVSYAIAGRTEGVDYDGTDSGRFNSLDTLCSPIHLAPSSVYLLNLSNSEGLLMPTTDFIASDDGVLSIEKTSNSTATLRVANEPDGTESFFKIRIRNSDIETRIPIAVKDISSVTISERTASEDNTRIIFIQDASAVKAYAVLLESASEQNRTLLAYLALQANGEDMSGSIPLSLKSPIVAQSNEYFALNFNGEKKTLSITPKKDTMEGGRNLHYYLYVYDANENFFGRWRIMIGGDAEGVQISESEISARTQSSSSVSATVEPENGNPLIWYISKSRGDGITPPPPMAKDAQDLMVSFLESDDSENDIAICGIKYSASECSFAKTYGPNHQIHWTCLGEAASAYLVALDEKSGCYDAVPFLISAESGIILRCLMPISDKMAGDMVFDGNRKEFEDAMRPISFPYGQRYPDTYMKGEHGLNTRTFFLPHDSVSKIEIETSNVSSLEASSIWQGDQLFSYRLLDTEIASKRILEITPVWLSLNDAAKTGSSPAPCQDKDSGADLYGKIFYQYLGSASLSLNAQTRGEESQGEYRIRLRIVLFEN